MIHRYVAIVATDMKGPTFPAAVARLKNQLSGWTTILDSPIACVWYVQSHPSRLGFRALGPTAVMIGLDFPAYTEAEPALHTHKPDDVLTRRWGAYVGFWVDVANRRIDVVRDPTGRIECWRLALAGFDILFSHYGDLEDLTARPPAFNWDYLLYHLSNTWVDNHETALQDVSELLPGQQLTYVDGCSETLPCWHPSLIAEHRFESLAEAKVAIRTAAEQSISVWSNRYNNLILDLSGGLDSAIVLGLLRGHAQHPHVTGVNYVTVNAEGDERAYARAAADMFGITLIEEKLGVVDRCSTPSSHLRVMRPTVRTMPLGYDEIGIRITRQLGADAHFTGTGGDHLFMDGLNVSAAGDYFRHHGLGRDLVSVSHELALMSKSTIWSAFGAAFAESLRRRPSMQQRLCIPNSYVRPDALRATHFDRFAHPWLLSPTSNTGPGKLEQIESLISLQRHYWRYGRADVAEEVHPLYSQPLIEACLRTPAYWFGVGGRQRGLAREVFSDVIPDIIRKRRTKGANTSLWMQTIERDRDFYREILLDGKLVAHGFLDGKKLEASLNPMSAASNRSQGALVICITTELWIRQIEKATFHQRDLRAA